MEKLSKEKCLWERLKTEKKPIFLYGTGNGADKILDVLERSGIPVSGVFASADFVRNRTFRGFPVRSLSDTEAEFEDFTVLLAFGTTLPDVTEKILDVSRRHTLLIPEVPLYGDTLFDYGFYEENFPVLEKTEKIFADDTSKALFSDLVNFRLTGEPEYLFRLTETPEITYRTLLSDKKYAAAVDCGAYRGDSAECIANTIHPSEIIAMEPDPKTFLRLKAFGEEHPEYGIIPVNAAAAEKNGTTEITASAGRGSGVNSITKKAKTVTVETKTVDSLGFADGNSVDFIKYDVEGDEWEALAGSLDTIRHFHPYLSVSVYHRTEDLYKIPLFLKELYPSGKIYLRRAPCIPAWDIIAVVKN